MLPFYYFQKKKTGRKRETVHFKNMLFAVPPPYSFYCEQNLIKNITKKKNREIVKKK